MNKELKEIIDKLKEYSENTGYFCRKQCFIKAATFLEMQDDEIGMMRRACNYPVKKIIVQGPATVVIWKDGTKTIVKRAHDDDHDVYAAFCAALAKKVYGGNSTVKNIVDRNIVIKG